MKHFIKKTMALLLIGLLAFCSCAKSPNAENSSATPSASPERAVKENGGELVLSTDPYGGLYKLGYGIETGYYDQFNVTGKAVNLLYTDYQTKQRVYLCNRPDCKHNDETCTSWLPTYGDTKLFASKSEDQLFFVSSGYADTPNATGSQLGRIYSMDLTGSNRKVLYQLNGKESFSDAIVMDDNALYVTVSSIDAESTSVKKELRMVNISDGTATLIYQFESANDRVFGAFEQTIVIQRYTDAELFYECLDLNTDTKTQNYRRSIDDIRLEMVYGQTVYSIRRNNEQPDAPSPIYAVDLLSGEEKIVSEIQIYNTDATFIVDVYDGRMEISATDNRDVDNIKFHMYNLNFNTYELNENTLTFPFFQDIRNVTILAQTKDFFLVEMGITQGNVTLYDNAGTPYQVDTAIPTHALITKTDFWKGVPNYIPIQNNVGS
ncbi:MAG: hypothetical protein RR576_09695 [Oscillospiraceae bacterium]